MTKDRKKTGGRTKGVQNKNTPEKKHRAEKILQLIESDYFDKDIKHLSPSQRLNLYSEMLEYVMPKLSRQEVNAHITQKIISIEYGNNLSRDSYTPLRAIGDTPAEKAV